MAARSYLAFGSDDKENWAQLKTVIAGGAPQALNLARAQESHRYYAVVPERNWSSAEPEVEERAPLVRWKPLTPGQMRIDDDASEEPTKIREPEERRVL